MKPTALGYSGNCPKCNCMVDDQDQECPRCGEPLDDRDEEGQS